MPQGFIASGSISDFLWNHGIYVMASFHEKTDVFKGLYLAKGIKILFTILLSVFYTELYLLVWK